MFTYKTINSIKKLIIFVKIVKTKFINYQNYRDNSLALSHVMCQR